MSFALLIIGITLVVAAVRNTQGTLITLLYGDFTGEANFLYWIAALLIIGAVGYVDKLKPLSDGLLVIVLLALILSRGNPDKNIGGGFFKQFTDALKGTTKAPESTTVAGAVGALTGNPGAITNPSTWTTLPDGTVLTPTGR